MNAREEDIDVFSLPISASVFPITVQQMLANDQYPQECQQFEYTPLSFKVIKDLKQAGTIYGMQSNYFKGLLQGLAQEYCLIPYDWDILARTVAFNKKEASSIRAINSRTAVC